MAFFNVSANGEQLLWKLSSGDRKYHFFFFRIYSVILATIGVMAGTILFYEEPNSYLWLIGLLAVIPAMMMFFTEYPIEIVFGKHKVSKITKNTWKGTTNTEYLLADYPILYTTYFSGRFGGQYFGLMNEKGKKIRLGKVPWPRLKRSETLRQMRIAAEFSGLKFKEYGLRFYL